MNLGLGALSAAGCFAFMARSRDVPCIFHHWNGFGNILLPLILYLLFFGILYIPQAMLLDYYSPAFRYSLAALERDKAYFIYCRSASRTGRATAMMQELGFRKVFELRGGVRAWISSGRTLHVH